jgi:hypothetical protein
MTQTAVSTHLTILSVTESNTDGLVEEEDICLRMISLSRCTGTHLIVPRIGVLVCIISRLWVRLDLAGS